MISVIIDNFNYARFLRAAIDSALAQTCADKEVIVVDDGSTDESAQIIHSYGDRIIPVLKQNAGQASAFNAGFAKGRGDVICLLDADDVWVTGKLSEIAALAERFPEASTLFHRCTKINGDGNCLPQAPRPREIVRGNIRDRVRRSGGAWPFPPTSALCFRREFLRQIMPIPEPPLRICADLYLATLAPFFGEVAGSPSSLMHYRIHDRNAWAATRRNLNDDLRRHEILVDLINQTLSRARIDDRIRLEDQLYYRLLKYRLGEESLLSLIRHTLVWPGERFTTRMKILLTNIRRARPEYSNRLAAQ
jgi:glycosyltransferase involved in cell wall biosynthesis